MLDARLRRCNHARVVDPHRAEWRPLPPAELRALLSAQRAPWWIAGGVALELFAGRSWRSHGDVDVGLLRPDQPALFAALDGWRRFAANDGALRELAPGESAPPEANSVWCRRAGEEAFRFELLLDASDGGEWIFRRDPRVRRPLAELVVRADDGCPYLRPEVQLLYKAKARRAKDEADFATVAPLLDVGARRWLRSALALVHPAHDWLARAELAPD
jgi:hypothetical protein